MLSRFPTVFLKFTAFLMAIIAVGSLLETKAQAAPAGAGASEVPATAIRPDESPVGYARGELATSISNESSWRKSKETKFAYKLGSGYDSFANEREQAQYFGFGLNGDFRAQLMSGLSFRVKGGASLTTGYAQSRFGDNVGASGIFMQEAVMTARAVDSKFLRAYVAGGALDQNVFEAPLFIARSTAFPGVRETLVIGNSNDFRIKLWAQQAIPTSKTLSTKTVDAEVTPSFLSETAEISIEPSDILNAKAAVTHFTFNNLPSAVALESVIYGNTVNEIGPNTSQFKYRFDGFMASGSLSLRLANSLSWHLFGYAIQNAAAEEGYRNAQNIQTGFKVSLPGEIDVTPTVSTFFIEDDAVPGFYNSSVAGHNNRQGFAASVDAYFQRQRFRVAAEYVDADVINFNINQSRQQTMTIKFETFYEML